MSELSTNNAAAAFSLKGGKIDVLKFILCVFVVLIHTINYSALSPILRCAVPVFFIISSYFFFKKYDGTEDVKCRRQVLQRYVSRNLKLYLFWFILLLPFTLLYRSWFDAGFLLGFTTFLRSLFFSSTFPASWYIMASILGVLIVCFLDTFKNKWLVYIIVLFSYVFCCLTSNYTNLMTEKVEKIYHLYKLIFTSPYNSFPASLIWILIGRRIAAKEKKTNFLNYKYLAILLMVCIFFLYFEYIIIHYFGLNFSDDCYVMLLPVCLLFILIFGLSKIEIKSNLFLRKTSTIVYCCHVPVSIVLDYIFKYLGIQSTMLTFISTLIAAIFISYLFIKLETRIKLLSFAS